METYQSDIPAPRPTLRLTLRKEERLRLRTLVDSLFKEGKTIYEFPLRLTWRAVTQEDLDRMFSHGIPAGIGEIQMMITVPKKKRRRAVDRVLIRRRVREAYRLSRLPLKEEIAALGDVRSLQLAFVYLGEDNAPFAEIEAKMRRLLTKLAKKLQK